MNPAFRFDWVGCWARARMSTSVTELWTTYLSATLRRRLHAGPVSPPDRDRFDACIAFVDISGFSRLSADSFWRHFTTWNVRYQAVLGFCAVVRRGSNASSAAGEAEKEEL